MRRSLRRKTELRGLEDTAKTASVSSAVCATRVCARQFERLSATKSRRHHTRARRKNDIHVVSLSHGAIRRAVAVRQGAGCEADSRVSTLADIA